MAHHIVKTPTRYAVLLNARAKGWTGSVHEAVQRYVSREDLFLTETFHQARRAVDKILSTDYDAIFAGGGDGTIVYLINEIDRRVQSGQLERAAAPPVGVLRLGTGNALATYLGSDDIIDDLRALRRGAQLTVHDVNMLQSGGELFPFAGMGWDADILNDYELVKDITRSTSLEQYATGLGGYAAAIITRTLPRVVRQRPMHVTITNLGRRALRVNYQGEVLAEFGPGDILYDAPARICAAASVPYWGFQVRMFPHADRYPDLFQVRCYSGNVPEVLMNLRDFWRGKLRDEVMHDHLVEHVRVEVHGAPVPYQTCGDAAGVEREVEWRITPQPVQLAVPVH